MEPRADIRGAGGEKAPWALKDLPPYRPVARKLMMLTAKADVPIEQVQQVLRTDAAFSADVLRVANSPLIGMRAPITGALQAVMMLGLERIKALATTLALRTFLASGVPAGALHNCWRHNLATAIVCDWLARILHIDSDTCYTAGMLHDVGLLALLRALPDRYERVLEIQSGDDSDLLAREKAIFDIDHCMAGNWILEHWEFPLALREIVSLHHQEPLPGSSDALRVVYAGWRIADLLGFSVLNRPVSFDIEQIVSALPGRAPRQVLDRYDGLAVDVAFKINAIECSLL